MEQENIPNSNEASIEKKGIISQKLFQDGIPNDSLDSDHLGIEII